MDSSKVQFSDGLGSSVFSGYSGHWTNIFWYDLIGFLQDGHLEYGWSLTLMQQVSHNEV